MTNWLAPKDIDTPDFIICGAMKSGTSTIHAILNKHPDIYIPDNEVHFFDMDNMLQHPDFNCFSKDGWSSHFIERSPEKYWAWYKSQFTEASSTQLKGEDSTTYLASEIALKRISLQKKPTKVIVMLRQPTSRAYSQYWHLVRSGRAIHNFENTLRFNPYSLVNRSLYAEQIRNLLKYFPQEQVKFVIFEEFLNDKSGCIADICQFLGVNNSMLPSSAINLHENSATYPKYVGLQLLKNKFSPTSGHGLYLQHFQIEKINTYPQKLKFSNVIEAIHRKLNPLVPIKPEKMLPETKKLLDRYFLQELSDLNELIGKDVLSHWFR